MVKVEFVDAVSASRYEGQKEPIVITIDPISSGKIIDHLFPEDGSDASEGKKRKASESFFRVRQRDGTFLLAQEAFSLQLSRLPSMKKMVVNFICEHLKEDDTVRLYCDAAANDVASINAAEAFIIIVLMCRFDAILVAGVFDSAVQRLASETGRFSMTISSPGTDATSSLTTRGEELELSVTTCMEKLCTLLGLGAAFSEDDKLFIRKLTLSTIKDRHYYRDVKRSRYQLDASQVTAGEHPTDTARRPSQRKDGEGWRVFEFFSGIGGMRLGLPDEVDGVPITSLTAFDCSTIANQVYNYNFHDRPEALSQPSHVSSSHLRTMLVQHLTVQAANNAADIWTMSPPCQPFTRTRNARRLDDKDTRSQGLYHLMTLLLNIQYMPRYIMVENVQGFLGSKMHTLWCQVLVRCQYRFHEFLLSPDKTVGLPNSRTRYYCVARFDAGMTGGGDRVPRSLGYAAGYSQAKDLSEASEEMKFMQRVVAASAPTAAAVAAAAETATSTTTVATSATGGDKGADEEEDEEEGDDDNEAEELADQSLYKLAQVPSTLAHDAASTRGAVPIEDVLGERYAAVNQSPETVEKLLISRDILTSSWAGKNLSIVTIRDRLTYCFTKGYGKRVDHSAGSCLYIGESTGSGAEVDRLRLPEQYGKLRMFHPNELLLLFGFPPSFTFPASMSLQHQWGCIGNSVNVAVVRMVMRCLFENEHWSALR